MSKNKGMERHFKSGAMTLGDSDELRIERLGFGITPLDEITGGGIPYGTCALVVGPESTGKTILAQYLIKQQQQTDKPNVLYLDAERTYDRDWWEQTGIDVSKLYVARVATAEDYIDLAIDVLRDDAELGMIVLDSIAALPPSRIVTEDAGRNDVASLALAVSKLYTKLVPELGKCIFLATNQMRENLTGYEERYPGGVSQKYFSHIILRTRREGWIKDGNKRTGYNMEVLCRKNKTSMPQGAATIPFMFDSQLDILSIQIDDAIAQGIIRQNLPYYYIGEERFMGRQNLRNYLLENPDALEGV